jgi:hypothetical protein
MKKVVGGFAFISIVVLLAGCGKTLQGKLNAVTRTLDSAYAEGANTYLSLEYANLEDSVKAVITDIDLENTKWFKNPKPKKIRLDSIHQMASQLKANIILKKIKAKREADSLIITLQTVIEENEKLIEKAKTRNKGNSVFEQHRKEISLMDSSLMKDKFLFKKGLYLDVINNVKVEKSMARNINRKLKYKI